MKEWLQDFLNQEVLHNPMSNCLWFVGILLIGLFIRRAISGLLSRQLFRLVKREAQNIPITKFVRLLHKPLEVVFTLTILYLAFDRLTIPAEWGWASVEKMGIRMISIRVFEVMMSIVIAWIVIRFIKFIALIFHQRAEQTESKLDDQLVPFFRDLAIMVVVFIDGLIILDNVFGIDVAALLTGLGIGGLAIALAARETLENLFASFTIFLDLPFIVGDTVQVGTTNGDVEKVGFRSTRIRTADGSIITVPNRLMTSQALENQTQRQYRRAKFLIKLTYQTTSEQLRSIITAIQALIDSHPMTSNKRGIVKFDALSDSSLDVMVIFHVETADWRLFNDVKEEINFQIMQIVEEHRAQFAYPTVTYVRGEEASEELINKTPKNII